MKHFVGVDLGQASDYTAISVLNAIPTVVTQRVEDLDPDYGLPRDREVKVEGLPVSFEVNYLQRLPIGTSYPDVVSRVKEILTRLPAGTELIVDYTGVGRPVVDMLMQQGLNPAAVSITGGDTASRKGRFHWVPKRDLIGALAVALQNRQLKIASVLPDAGTLVTELQNFKVKINTKTGHDSYLWDWREGQHDDLVLSVALAAWAANFTYDPRNQRTYWQIKDNYAI